MNTRLLFFALLCFLQLTAFAQQVPSSYFQETKYLLYLPDGYGNDTTRKWPLVVFLHGSGEAGTDLDIVKKNGPPHLIDSGKKFPFIVVSPQSLSPAAWEVDPLYHFVQGMEKKFRVDKDRVYLTGLSMGGYGTWALAIKHPEEFAAMVPICGGGDDTADCWKLRHIPVWSFHGAEDHTVPIIYEQRLIDATRKYNPNVRFTVYPGVGHNSWINAYNTDSLYTWLLQQKKFRFKEIAVPQNNIADYTGKYADAAKDTITIGANNGKLFVVFERDTTVLKYYSSDRFFIQEDLPFEGLFIRDKQNIVQQILFYGEKKQEFKRLSK